MRTFLILLGSLTAVSASAQAPCALPDTAPFMFELIASRVELDRTQYFQLDHTGTLFMGYYSRADVPASAMPGARVLLGERDSSAAVLAPLYSLAREVICGVRFPDATADAIEVSYDAPIAEVWVRIGDASLGTRLNAADLPPAASALFEELDQVAQGGM